MYIFTIGTVLVSVSLVCAIFYSINVGQIDRYFKQQTIDHAKNFASFTDVEFLKELRAVAESEEYQALRDKAEAEDDEEAIRHYLEEKGLWDRYEEQRNILDTYLNNMDDIKYLYIIVWGDINADHDMYLIDDKTIPIYETGYYEEREAEFEGVDPTTEMIEPVISNGDWGWLCSGYYAILDDEGNIVAHVGCDVGMEEVMKERHIFLYYIIMSALLCTAIVLALAIYLVNKIVVRPLKSITNAMERFNPVGKHSYEEAGVINLDIRKGDEIGDIYDEIHEMQVRIVDYINDISEIRHDKELAEDNVRNKEEEIGIISREAYKDSLTGVGNKTAYSKKAAELNEEIKNGLKDLAIVMIDLNGLKNINDNYGHSNGDTFIKGCCHTICEVFKHSPVYRIGGDEFVAVLTGEDYKDRTERMKELKECFDASGGDTQADPWLRYSASAGIAGYSEGDENVEAVFARADKVMYEEKSEFKKKQHT
jgi:diguanylate cyclase (GGDEF)-like protein